MTIVKIRVTFVPQITVKSCAITTTTNFHKVETVIFRWPNANY